MASVLHLTDLHLKVPGAYGGGDMKSQALPEGHRPTRDGEIRDTIEALAASDEILPFDAVVITGDIPWKNGEEGWRAFETLLEPLAERGKLPAPDHIVVTPGNHDVRWYLPVDDPQHYEHFKAFIRARGYVTPLLDGEDFDADGNLAVTDPAAHYLFDAELGLAIVPLNSSHYCGVVEPLKEFEDEDKLAAALRPLGVDVADRVLKELGTQRALNVDIPRISEQQLRALTRLLEKLDQAIVAADVDESDLVRIAAVHHHLLPVGSAEEFKPFESLTNLGQVRGFLADKRFRVALHGHKHAAGVYWDRIRRSGHPPAVRDWNLLVVSGSTLGSKEQGRNEVARILDVQPQRRQRTLNVARVPAVALGGQLPSPLDTELEELWLAEMEPPLMPRIIAGTEVGEVYDRIQALFAGLGDAVDVRHLVCEVRHSPSADVTLPAGYPSDVPGETQQDRENWFTSMVSWWERTDSRLLEQLHFTHGQRLRAFGGTRFDQLGAAVTWLQRNAETSRAVMTLLDPAVDLGVGSGPAGADQREFPSFSLVHLTIREGDDHIRYLDCLGVFRKQEMRYWWPINVAELQRIQTLAMRQLAQPDLQRGAIVTYSAIAHVLDEVPAVSVTAVDRLADDEPRLRSMAYVLAHPDAESLEQALKDWSTVLDDLTPKDEAVPRPLLGLELLVEHVRFYAHMGASDRLTYADEQLASLMHHYATFENNPQYARDKIDAALQALRDLVGQLDPSDPDSTIATAAT
jgi:3',5'-cyclic AMP phosphodiesterase CpdA